jgi:hypothetical protein
MRSAAACAARRHAQRGGMRSAAWRHVQRGGMCSVAACAAWRHVQRGGMRSVAACAACTVGIYGAYPGGVEYLGVARAVLCNACAQDLARVALPVVRLPAGLQCMGNARASQSVNGRFDPKRTDPVSCASSISGCSADCQRSSAPERVAESARPHARASAEVVRWQRHHTEPMHSHMPSRAEPSRAPCRRSSGRVAEYYSEASLQESRD